MRIALKVGADLIVNDHNHIQTQSATDRMEAALDIMADVRAYFQGQSCPMYSRWDLTLADLPSSGVQAVRRQCPDDH